MPINILMPALSPTMEKGNLAKWLKKEGDKVKSGDVIAEIETDKATMEVEAVDEGTLAKILVPEGTQDVPVNQPIAVLAVEGEEVTAAPRRRRGSKSRARFPKPGARCRSAGLSQRGEAGWSAAKAGSAQSASSPKPDYPTSPRGERWGAKRRWARGRTVAAASATAGQVRARDGDGAGQSEAAIFSSPLARRLASDAGIELVARRRLRPARPHHRARCRAGETGQGTARPAAAPALRLQPPPC